MTDQELIKKCPMLLGLLKGAPGPTDDPNRRAELIFIRSERPVEDALRMRAEFAFGPLKRGVSWNSFVKRYERVGAPSYGFAGLGA
jgi:hypothetical protein